LKQTPAVSPAENITLPNTPDSSNTSTTELFPVLSSMDQYYLPTRNSILEKWSKKVHAASSLVANKSFKALNRPIHEQINMDDGGRGLNRTRLRREGGRVLGTPFPEDGLSLPSNSNNSSMTPLNSISSSSSSSSSLPISNTTTIDNKKSHSESTAMDVETFNDTDFYSSLLSQFLTSRLTNTTHDPDTAFALLREMQRKSRVKKQVERRASKGRKIRYHVMEKVVGFMEPQPAGTWPQGWIGGLFGKESPSTTTSTTTNTITTSTYNDIDGVDDNVDVDMKDVILSNHNGPAIFRL